MKKLFIGLLAFLIAIPVFAQELQSSYHQKFSGLNTKVTERLLEEDESPDCSNFALDEVGAITERDIFSQYNATSGLFGNNPIRGLWKFYTTSSKDFIGCAGAKIVSGTAAGFDTDITQSGLAISEEQYWDAVTFGDFIYLFNSSIALQRWGTTGNTVDVTTPPTNNCKYAAVHKNRIWAGGAEVAPYRLYFSSLSNGMDWTATGGFADIPDESAHITGVKSWGGKLYVFTETNVYYVYGSTPNDFALVKTDSDVGCIAPRSIQVTESGIMFLARTGVFRFTGARAYKVSDKITPTINNISRTYIKDACGLWDGDSRYWLSYAGQGSTINDKVLIYDTLLKEWYPYDNLNISYFCRAHGPGDRGELYGGSANSDGMIWLLQALGGTENIVHDTISEFLTGTTFNTVAWGTETSPEIILDHYSEADNLLLHCEGADGSTTFTDASETGHGDATVGATAQVDTAQYKWGTGSLLLDGNSDYLQYADNADWDFTLDKTDSRTVDVWIKCAVADIGADEIIIGAGDVLGGTDWYLARTSTEKIQFYYEFASVLRLNMSTTATIDDTDWHHIALIKVEDDYSIYIDGEQESFATTDVETGFDTGLTIGAVPKAAPDTNLWNGHLDEIRIQNTNYYGATPNAGKTDEITLRPYYTSHYNGNIASTVLQINASDASTLGTITWDEDLPTADTDIQFTTRTGATGDTVYFNGWETWVSTSTSVNRMLESVSWSMSDSANMGVFTVASAQARNVWSYETYDNVSPSCVEFRVSRGTASTNDYVFSAVPEVDISSYKWIGYWLKSPATGNSVVLYLGETTGNTIGYCTAATVSPNTWEHHYWPLSSYASANLDEIKYVEFKYVGDMQGSLYLGEIHAYDFFNSDEIMTSTPNDFIQYRAIEGTIDYRRTPILYEVTLEYTPTAGAEETSLSSYYKTKWLTQDKPMFDKQYLDLFLEAASDNDAATIYIDYDIDHGTKTGTFTYTISSTPNTVRKEKHFSGSTFGKTIQYNIRNTDLDAKVTIRALETRFKQEGFQ